MTSLKTLLSWAMALVVLTPSMMVADWSSDDLEATDASQAHPRLLFDSGDVPALRQRVQSGVPAAAYQRLLSRADAYVNGTYRSDPDSGPGGMNQYSTVLTELGLAYQLSQDTRYSAQAIHLLRRLAANGWPSVGYVEGQWNSDVGVGDLMAGVGLAFDWTYEQMTAEDRSVIVSSLATHKQKVFGVVFWGTPHLKVAHSGTSAGGAGLAMLAIEGEPGAPGDLATYQAEAHRKVGAYLATTSGPDGEPSEGYHYLTKALKNTIPYALAARRMGKGDILSGTPVTQTARWAVYEHIPIANGHQHTMLPLNDSLGVVFSNYGLPLLMAAAPDDGVTQWFWQRTAGPLGDDFYGRPRPPVFVTNLDCAPTAPLTNTSCPFFPVPEDVFHILFWRSPQELPEVSPQQALPLSKWFSHHGLVVARSGFTGPADAVSSFQARRNAQGGHRQADLGSFTLYGAGGHWALDSGYSCAQCQPREETRLAKGHNVVLIDGDAHTQDENASYLSDQSITTHVGGPTMSYAHAGLRYAYNPQATRAERDHLLTHAPGRPVFLAVTDRINRDGAPHDYAWRMHTDAANVGGTLGAAFTMIAPSGAVMIGRASSGSAPGDDPAFTQETFVQKTTTDMHPVHTVLSAETRGVVTYDNLAVIAVTPPGGATTNRAANRTLSVTGGNAIAVNWEGVEDVFAATAANSTSVTGPELTTDGRLAHVQKGAGETLLANGTALTVSGRDYVTVTGTRATVIVSGDEAQAVGGSGTNSYRVYAPQQIVTVTVDGVAVGSCRSGDYLVFPC